jgi:hypothetical protein
LGSLVFAHSPRYIQSLSVHIAIPVALGSHTTFLLCISVICNCHIDNDTDGGVPRNLSEVPHDNCWVPMPPPLVAIEDHNAYSLFHGIRYVGLGG